ncbi:hypothetical protein ACH5RR_035318 [Cinchona calisaya]|uniref:Uncharacterized protein n=1 Tax=Cinchona calisaya TaxID=153742 RepID=A0ABD2YGH2_9GENT
MMGGNLWIRCGVRLTHTLLWTAFSWPVKSWKIIWCTILICNRSTFSGPKNLLKALYLADEDNYTGNVMWWCCYLGSDCKLIQKGRRMKRIRRKRKSGFGFLVEGSEIV